jgi:hypothetical protein
MKKPSNQPAGATMDYEILQNNVALSKNVTHKKKNTFGKKLYY